MAENDAPQFAAERVAFRRRQFCRGRGLVALLLGLALVASGCESKPAANGSDAASSAGSPSANTSTSAPSATTAASPETSTPATVPGAATAVPTVAATSPATSTISPSVPTATPTPPPSSEPERSVAVGQWSFEYYLAGNTCAGAPDVTYLPVTQEIEEVGGSDGFISDGEQVRIYDFNGGASLGLLTFHWPILSYQAPLNEPGGIRMEVTHTFIDSHSGTSKVVEVYTQGSGTCEVTYSQ